MRSLLIIGGYKMKEKIAEIKLSPGQVGFYDELTNIHLTIASPFGQVYRGMNTSRIKASVASKKLILLSGTLNLDEVVANEIELNESKKAAEAPKEAKPAKEAEEAVAAKELEKAEETDAVEAKETVKAEEEAEATPAVQKSKTKKK